VRRQLARSQVSSPRVLLCARAGASTCSVPAKAPDAHGGMRSSAGEGPRHRNATHSGVSPHPAGRLPRPGDAQAESLYADGSRRAAAFLRPETPGWPRRDKSRSTTASAASDRLSPLADQRRGRAGARRTLPRGALQLKPGARVHHRRATSVDGRDDLLRGDSLQVGAGRGQVRVPELALDQR
jgi:hypothetical protein